MLNELALNGIMQDESALSTTQNQLSTGKSINSPADNPVGEVQLLQLTNTSAQYQQYVSNGQSANTNLTLEQNALTQQLTTTLQSIQRPGGTGQQRQQQHRRSAEHRDPDPAARAVSCWAPPTARMRRASTCSPATR